MYFGIILFYIDCERAHKSLSGSITLLLMDFTFDVIICFHSYTYLKFKYLNRIFHPFIVYGYRISKLFCLHITASRAPIVYW